ncbi:CLUMA_CG014024, isoform A [Clunio marinus]|uniref:CLUMA_CG014024, isoform A n=1 Tax=Clunio marinus TaxID=568069 RepID=A0A1J1IQI8_9DIPT|nr:CLUMA_CG014024, isoform A [Clunio marinus]
MDLFLEERKVSENLQLKEIFRRKYKTSDPNCYDPSENIRIFEKILRTKDSSIEIEWCMKNGAQLYTKNENKKYPIMYAIDSLCPKNLQTFLDYYDKSKINVKFEDRNCLHLLLSIFEMSSKRSEFKNVAECIKILVDAGCDPNSPDVNSRTPFFMLLKLKSRLDIDLHKNLVEWFLQKSTIDVYSYRSEEMIQMLKVQNFPIPEKIENFITFDYLCNLIHNGNETEFIECFNEFYDNFGVDMKSEIDSGQTESTINIEGGENSIMLNSHSEPQCQSYNSGPFFNSFEEKCATFLIESTKNGIYRIVECLLQYKIDINKFPEFEQPAAFIACSRGYWKILELFLSHRNSGNIFDLCFNYQKKNLLHEICSHFGMDNNLDKNQDYQKCFDMLLPCADVDVNQQDELGFTPLYYAIRYKNDKATKALLKKCYVGRKNIFNRGQIFNIDKEVLEDFLDDCISLDVNETTVLLDNQFEDVHNELVKIIGTKTVRIIRAITILCATFEFLILFGDLPFFSVSTHMIILKRVFVTFLKSFALYSILLVGFAFCFYTLFGDTSLEVNDKMNSETNESKDSEDDFHQFRYPGFALIKTIVMFSGELEASSIDLKNNDAVYSLIFLLFVFLITIVLLNLINGLSVSDVFQIKAEGHLVDLCHKIHVLNKYERIVMDRRDSSRYLKAIISIFPEFVTNGIIEIDFQNKIKLNSLGSKGRESILDSWYNQMFENLMELNQFMTATNKNEKRKLKPVLDDGFHITLNRKIMRRIKSVIENRDEKHKTIKLEEKITNIENNLKLLATHDTKLDLILKFLDPK